MSRGNNNDQQQQQYSQQIQQAFIQQAVNEKKNVNVFLINGVKLQGVIESHDEETIVVSYNRNNSGQLVYKHAISTIQTTT